MHHKWQLKIFLALFMIIGNIPAYDSLNIDTVVSPQDTGTHSITVFGKRLRDVVQYPRLESPGLTASTSIVSDSAIERQGAKNLVQALQYVPGTFVESRGKKVKQFVSFRGQKYPYPTYAVEGAWQNEFQEMPYFFSSGDIERIEITRSSAALLSSLTSLSGVVNVILKKFDTPATQYEVEYGSFETYHAHLLHGATVPSFIGPVQYTVGVTADYAEGPEDKHGAQSLMNFYGYTGFKPVKNLSLDMRLFHFFGKREMQAFENPPQTDLSRAAAAAPGPINDPFGATFFNLKSFYIFNSKASLEVIAYYTDRSSTFENQKYYTTKDSIRYYDSKTKKWTIPDSLTGLLPATIDKDWEWGVNATQALALLNNNILRVGGLYNHWTAPNGKRYYSGTRCENQTYSFVLVDEHKLGVLTLDAGLRAARTYNDEYTAVKDAYDNNLEPKVLKSTTTIKDTWDPSVINGNIGASYYVFEELVLHTNVAFGTVAARTGTMDTTYNKPADERRIKIDAGATFSNPLGKVTLTGFFIQRKDALLLSNKMDTLPDGRIYALYRNRTIDIQGVEVDFRSAEIYNLATVFANGMIKKTQYDSLENTPDRIASAGLTLEKLGLTMDIFAKYIGPFENMRFSPDGAIHPLGDFVTVDMVFGYQLNQSTRAYVRIENLTDERYSTAIGYPDFGRKLALGVTARVQ
ncbi:MAG: TonB-dependent receptor plug domain-containing protein [bacterium]